ncbi:MAG: membrane protein insertion efficiency factor YidD [Candidatus Omnitrophica bacterium]|nr:membrane protein insertion efficiency factor YidD [Candidatus Omnitrophota bacterium]
MKKVAIFSILFVSNLFRSMGLRSCRFHPTCSRYAVEAFETLSFSQAFFLTLKRVFRCHPFSEGGVAPLVRGGRS